MKKKIIKKRLGEVLIERGLISHEQLDQALAVQKKEGGLVGEILIKMGSVTDDSIAWALAVQYGIPYLPVLQYEIPEEMTKLVSKETAEKYRLVPLDRIGGILTVAMSNPLNAKAVEEVQSITALKVQIFVTTASDLNQTIERFYKAAP